MGVFNLEEQPILEYVIYEPEPCFYLANDGNIFENDIITKINNKVINNSNDFSKIMNSAKNNTYVNLLVYRQTTPLFIALKISK